ncbi:MAG: hypothetical protein IJE43_08680, partial [Alphaproteobacteria bacterium]|nr:hypothetical protein [Alphaproteobacteria bacterium]
MKLKERLRNKLKKWLFADEIQKINHIERTIDDSVHRFRMASVQLGDAENQLHNAEKEVEECRKLLTQLVDIGVDVGFHSEDHSWAVICIAGKQEYVKFLPLETRDARDVLRFLKQFEYSRQVIDSPIAFKSMLKNRFLER